MNNQSSRRDFLRAAAIVGVGLSATTHASSTSPSTSTTRECMTFMSGGQKCFGMLHRPATQTKNLPGVLIMHGLVASKDQPHRIFVTLAEELARQHFISYRFDLRGRGDSEGESIDVTPAADIADARNALQVLANVDGVDAQRLIVLGLSWGGVLAAILAPDSRVIKTVLWSSAPSDDAWSPKLKDYNGRRAIDMFGNLIGEKFFQGLRDIHPLAELKKSHGPVLIVRGSADEIVPAAAVEKTKTDLTSANVKVETFAIDGADHALMKHEWERAAIERTVAWLKL